VRIAARPIVGVRTKRKRCGHEDHIAIVIGELGPRTDRWFSS